MELPVVGIGEVGVGDDDVTPYRICRAVRSGALQVMCPSSSPMPAWPAAVLIRSLST
jgi:hypothetical protein